MSQTEFQRVWFSTEKRNRSITKTLVLDDSGRLTLGHDSLDFTGRKLKIHIPRIRQISLARQSINWVMYLILDVVLILYFIFFLGGFPLFIWLPMLVVCNFFGLVIGFGTKWVRVEYLDDNNNSCLAFFADGSSFGWGGIFGGTKRMYRSLKSSLQANSSTPSWSAPNQL